MRIVSGEFRGRALVAPPGTGTRPTADRVRQALFDVLAHAPWSQPFAGLRVMDLFAGSGALGLEAISRGAAFCLFVETEAQARGAIRDNIEAFGLFGRSRIHRRDAVDLGVKPAADGAAFDLAFLDPPYARGLGDQALAGLLQGGWLVPGAICILERGKDEPAVTPPGFEMLDLRAWGPAQVQFLTPLRV